MVFYKFYCSQWYFHKFSDSILFLQVLWYIYPRPRSSVCRPGANPNHEPIPNRLRLAKLSPPPPPPCPNSPQAPPPRTQEALAIAYSPPLAPMEKSRRYSPRLLRHLYLVVFISQFTQTKARFLKTIPGLVKYNSLQRIELKKLLAHLFQLLIPLSEAGISMWLIIRKVDLHSFAQFLTQNSLLIQDFSFLNRTSALLHSTLSWTRTCSTELLCILNLNSVFNYLVLVSIPLTYYGCN